VLGPINVGGDQLGKFAINICPFVPLLKSAQPLAQKATEQCWLGSIYIQLADRLIIDSCFEPDVIFVLTCPKAVEPTS